MQYVTNNNSVVYHVYFVRERNRDEMPQHIDMASGTIEISDYKISSPPSAIFNFNFIKPKQKSLLMSY